MVQFDRKGLYIDNFPRFLPVLFELEVKPSPLRSVSSVGYPWLHQFSIRLSVWRFSLDFQFSFLEGKAYQEALKNVE